MSVEKKEWWKPGNRADHDYSRELMQIITADNAAVMSGAEGDGQLALG